MNKNLPVEIWLMIDVERRRVFRLRVEELEPILKKGYLWKKEMAKYLKHDFTNLVHEIFLLYHP